MSSPKRFPTKRNIYAKEHCSEEHNNPPKVPAQSIVHFSPYITPFPLETPDIVANLCDTQENWPRTQTEMTAWKALFTQHWSSFWLRYEPTVLVKPIPPHSRHVPLVCIINLRRDVPISSTSSKKRIHNPAQYFDASILDNISVVLGTLKIVGANSVVITFEVRDGADSGKGIYSGSFDTRFFANNILKIIHALP